MSNAKQIDYVERLSTLGRRISIPFKELYVGFTAGIIPWEKCFVAIALIQLMFAFHLDYALFLKFHLKPVYPRAQWLYAIYYYSWLLSPFLMWGMYRATLAAQLKKRLTDVFKDIGLQTKTGKLPNLIYDVPLDEMTRKLRLSKRSLTPGDFEKAKFPLESALHIYIDAMRDDREMGAVDIIYSHSPMVDSYTVKDYKNYHRTEFIVGTTRSRALRANLLSVPHLLVAGQTGGGKSTFLRHLITTLYLSDQNAHFTLIDLKGGLEFQLFENLDRVVVSGDIGKTVGLINDLDETLAKRMEFLKARGCKDIVQLQESSREHNMDLHRHIVVVDEAAELFLTNPLAQPEDVRTAKEVLSRISRQGRAVGIHLVIATQRPDSRALDPQIKSNLPGVLCFQMVNDASSITVLGTGRATDLPPIPGRGIWKNTQKAVEVQTPYLPIDRAETLLAPHKTEKKSSNQDPQPDATPKTTAPKSLSVESGTKK